MTLLQSLSGTRISWVKWVVSQKRWLLSAEMMRLYPQFFQISHCPVCTWSVVRSLSLVSCLLEFPTFRPRRLSRIFLGHRCSLWHRHPLAKSSSRRPGFRTLATHFDSRRMKMDAKNSMIPGTSCISRGTSTWRGHEWNMSNIV